MKRRTPHYIKPETICIGDTLAVSYTEADALIRRVAKVTSRQILSPNQTSYFTKLGWHVLSVFTTGETSPPSVKVVLLDRAAPNTQIELQGYKELT